MSGQPRARVLRAWLAVVLWSLLILRLSGDDFAAASTSRILAPLLAWLLPGAAPNTLEALHLGIRKAAHVGEYAVLGALTLWALGRSAGVGALGSALLTLLLVTSVAGLDESRQARSAARTGSVADVGLDAAGGGLAVVGAALRRRRRRAPARLLGREPVSRTEEIRG